MNRRAHRRLEVPYDWRLGIALLICVLGALVMLVVYMGLSSRGFTAKIATPLVSASDTRTVRFECRDNTVFKPDIQDLADRSSAALGQCVGTDLSRIDSCMRILDAKPLYNAYYSARPGVMACSGGSRPAMFVALREVPGSRGENVLELQEPDSVFRRELAQLDPNRVHLIFLVREDSFEVFQSARKIARNAGFRAGWEPFERSTPLSVGGCGGRSTGFRELPQ